jgi:hypothetical protein
VVRPRRHGLNILNSVIQAIPFLDDFDQNICICRVALPYQCQDTLVGIQFVLDGLLLCYARGDNTVTARRSFCDAAFAFRPNTITLLRERGQHEATRYRVLATRGESNRRAEERRQSEKRARRRSREL